MAGRDHGEVLTCFEEIFGSVVEHEVIKLILQSCDWDATTASDTLLGMIDKQKLDPHVLSTLNADSIVRELARKHPQEGGTPPSDHPVNMTPERDDLIHLANNSKDTINKSTTSDSTSNTSLITVPSSASAFHNGSPSTSQQTLMEERQNANSPQSAFTLIAGDSETSSPSFSPLRPNKSVNPGTSLDLNASEWVLAPEFVPNAFNWKASDLDVKHSVWRQGMSSKLMDAVPCSVPQSQQSKGKPGKKEEIINKILQGTKLLVLMRGLPGSGKTTLAKEMKGPTGVVLSTDDFFCDKHGRYIYDSSKIGEAHQWNKHRAIQRLKQGKTPIIIDNTNLQAWEMKPYVQLALQYGYEVNILDVDTPWRLSSKELARRNIHGVPAKKIEEMKGRYEHDVKLEDLIANLQGLGLTQQSPSRNASSKTSEGNVTERSSKGTDIVFKCSPHKTNNKPVIDADTEASVTVENSEFDSSMKDEIFDSDEDVIIEEYDDEITPISIHTSKNEVEVSHFDQNVTASGSKIEEALPSNQKNIIDISVPEEIANEVDALVENLDSPIDLTLALRTNDLKEEIKEDHAHSSENKSDTSHVNVLESGSDAYDEIKIQTLLDEACKSIDFSKSEEEWDNLTSQIAGEDFSDEKFNDLVTSFGSALKKQIKNKGSIGIAETEDDKVTSDTISEDSAMYDFCSTMEDKTGQPLSVLITKLTKNEDSTDITSIHLTGGTNNESQTNDESDKPASVDMTHCQLNSESLTSWECVDINSGLNSANWDAKSDNTESDKNGCIPKSCRSQRKRMCGDPSKWLNETNTSSENINDEVASWVAIEGEPSDWDTHDSPQKCPSGSSPSKSAVTSSTRLTDEEPQSHTGAISKLRKHRRKNNSSSPNGGGCRKDDGISLNDCNTVIDYEGTKTIYKSAETQTLSIDFEALELDHNLYELKVIFGQSHYVPVTTVSSRFSEKGPLTKGGLRLDKGTMTDNVYESSVANSFQTLVAFFPNIPKEDLRDVFEKCKHDSDWAMNVLLDSGYEMSDPSDITVKNLTEADVETDSVSETTNTDDGKNDNSSSDAYDIPCDSFSDEKTRKIKQSQLPEDIAKKIEIEKSFGFSESVDERVLRLTGKQYSDLNMTKIKKSRTKKHHVKRNHSPGGMEAKESVEEGGEGAQYITLVMDPLFASQLNMLFGPVGDCEISGDLTHEDRSVVLPLEICEMIHKYWARTVNGKFKHEAEILDSLVRQDEILAHKLQEEENAAFNLDERSDDINDSLPEDQPVCFQEIMNLEQALQESLSDRTHEDTSISSQLNLKRLYKEYPHIDPVALKEEYTRSGCKYSITVERLNQRYGKEQGTPKTVIAPEALRRYEQEMIERAQQNSLEEQEQVMSSNQHIEIIPDDPQIYRDEAQTHYHQRQEAFRKAQEAFRQGMKAAAAYYAHIGNLHSVKLREANQRASEKILEAQNAHRKDANCLDLHLLHVPEAISATQAFLLERQRVLIARGIKQMEVSLITGRGAHSAGGQAVLKPSIKEHLKKHGYTFYEANSGMLRVVLRSKPS
ncbi:NEDD4-binding protein 2-like 1 [Portunus trituberculatus]|uniref:NEDD4-binding protein 2-like 1 n=1 Tax=Portunus trituberculatus TaxID=210409 RepID=A0A5B7CHH0_PORTR|nr:NEDD4-binding protein 2-like 1 [Portunus trituberculatus]